MSESSEISTDVGTTLLFENDRVRVWDLSLEPGARIEPHRHHCDYLYVVIDGGRLQTEFPDGTCDPPRDMQDGDVRFRTVEGEAVHAARNVGDSPWRNIVVELKQEEGPEGRRDECLSGAGEA